MIGDRMLGIIRVLIISEDLLEARRITRFLDKTKSFKIDHEISMNDEIGINFKDTHYDFIIIDSDLINGGNQRIIYDNLMGPHKESNIVFISDGGGKDLGLLLETFPVLDKPVLESKLIECLLNILLDEINELYAWR